MRKCIFLILLFSCTDQAYLDIVADLSSEEDGRRRRSISRRSDNQCEDYERCQNICDQILEYSQERKKCYRLSLSDIGKIEKVFDLLKDPICKLKGTTCDNLDRIRSGDFELFSEFASHSWVRLIKGDYRWGRDARWEQDRNREEISFSLKDDYGSIPRYSSGEAQAVLNWILNNRWVGENLIDFGYGEDIMENLFYLHEGDLCAETNDCDTSEIEVSYGDWGEGVVKGLRGSDLYRLLGGSYLYRLVQSALRKDFSAFGLTHQVIQKICSSVDVNGFTLSQSEEYQFCISYIYFCESGLYPLLSPLTENDISDDRGWGLYINKNKSIRCSYLTLRSRSPNENEWIDSWDDMWH